MAVHAYYNEHDPFAADWLRELIKEGAIAPGDVDTRSIEDVTPNDLRHYIQHHFFAGIGGWSLALRLAGWPDSRPVWTGSCPCQPFSAAGKGDGFADERHLWPSLFHLIRECRPAIVLGEQVEAAINHGWLDLVQDDLEGEGYAFGAVGLPAASVGAPHIRQRLWWVAHRDGSAGGQGCELNRRRYQGGNAEPGTGSGGGSDVVQLADSSSKGLEEQRQQQTWRQCAPAQRDSEADQTGFWDDLEWLPCLDGKWRPTEPGIFPLAHGVPNRVGLLRGAGNAIVPQVAAEVILAFAEAIK